MSKVNLGCLFVLLTVLNFTSPAGAFVIINEFLADPPVGLAGDANGDTIGSSSQDEFVELFNEGAGAVDLSGWTLSDNYKVRHIFADGTIIFPGGVFVVFGGGAPAAEEFAWQVASSGGLGLNNTGDSVILADSGGIIADFLDYGDEANADQSLTRFPEGTPDAPFVRHTDLAGAEGQRFSPGFLVSAPGGSASVPEPLSVWGLGWGILSGAALRRKGGIA